MKIERVNAVIDRVMAEHPFTLATKISGQLKYYEAVHQELAPLARALEIENDRLQDVIRQYERQAFQKQRVTLTHVWTCNNCGNVYRGGQKEVTVFAENGHVFCRNCVKTARTWAHAPMTETVETRESSLDAN